MGMPLVIVPCDGGFVAHGLGLDPSRDGLFCESLDDLCGLVEEWFGEDPGDWPDDDGEGDE